MAEVIAIEPALFDPREAWFVMSDGRKLLRRIDPHPAPARSSFPCPAIRRDSIDPIRGPDGQVHESLSSYRRSLRPEGNPQGERYFELGNEELTPASHEFDRAQRRDDIKAGIEDVKNGRVPTPIALED